MNFGFSYVGLLYLIMLFVPNLLWTGKKPQDYDRYAKHENKILKIFEGAGQVLVTCTVLAFKDFNVNTFSLNTIWLAVSFAFMLLYEVYWIKYFKSEKTMQDFYSSLLGIPVPGAALPCIAFLLLGIYGRNIILILCVFFLSVGHIGIHINHKKELKKPL